MSIYEEDDANDARLPNFVDLARVNPAMLVPAVVTATLATFIFDGIANKLGNQKSRPFRATELVVFLTTLIDAANFVAAVTLDRSSSSGRLQIFGSLIHGLAAFFWRLFLWHHDAGDAVGAFCVVVTSSIFVILGELLETTAIVLTIQQDLLVPAICLVVVTPLLGTLWLALVFCDVCIGRDGRWTVDDVKTSRQPVMAIGSMLYIGIVTIAAVQDWRNIYLLLPEVPFDAIEHMVISCTGDVRGDEDQTVGSSTGTGRRTK
jgi:hypothetical protein